MYRSAGLIGAIRSIEVLVWGTSNGGVDLGFMS
nr:MAG TPA: hypothetical protein [Caudoviricetes sp.]